MTTTAATLARELAARAGQLSMNQQYWIGIAGAPGSGKSTLCRKIAELFGNAVAVIPMDGYHYTRQELDAMPDPNQAHARRGAPFTFDAERFVHDIAEARRSGEGIFPRFDHGVGDPVENAVHLSNHQPPLVLVEGNYVLLDTVPWRRLRTEIFDETWFLDVSIKECNRRVYERHLSTGKTHEEAARRVKSNDGPNGELVIATSRQRADRIIQLEPF